MFFGKLVQASAPRGSAKPFFEAAGAIAQTLGLQAEKLEAERSIAAISAESSDDKK